MFYIVIFQQFIFLHFQSSCGIRRVEDEQGGMIGLLQKSSKVKGFSHLNFLCLMVIFQQFIFLHFQIACGIRGVEEEHDD